MAAACCVVRTGSFLRCRLVYDEVMRDKLLELERRLFGFLAYKCQIPNGLSFSSLWQGLYGKTARDIFCRDSQQCQRQVLHPWCPRGVG